MVRFFIHDNLSASLFTGIKNNRGIIMYIAFLNIGRARDTIVMITYKINVRYICLLINLTILGFKLGLTRREFFVAYLQ